MRLPDNRTIVACTINDLKAHVDSKQAGLVSSRKDSRWVYYRLTGADKCDKNVISIINLSLSILEQDKEISKDDEPC